MSERYVKDILDKLEEIEQLHSKLRTLVPRVKNQEAVNNVSPTANLSRNKNERPIDVEEKNSSKQIPEAFKNLRKNSKANVRKLFTFGHEHDTNPKDNRWRRVRSNSVDYARKQWQDKKDKMKNLLSSMIEHDIILVNRGVQTLDNEQLGMFASVRNEEKTAHASKSDQPKKRRSSVQDQLERLLEHFNYSRNSDVTNEKRVSTQRHSFGKDDPRRVEKILSFPDEQAETLRVVSSAERVSISHNKKIS